MSQLRITSKRQATFPASTCEELGVSPGDRLELEKRTLDGKQVWVLSKVEPLEFPWLKITRPWVNRTNHDWDQLKQEIETERRLDSRRHSPT